MDRCVKCGARVFEPRKLWCKDCIKFVDAELEGRINKPWTFYFTYHRRCQQKSNAKDVVKES